MQTVDIIIGQHSSMYGTNQKATCTMSSCDPTFPNHTT